MLANFSKNFASKLAPTMGFRPNGLSGLNIIDGAYICMHNKPVCISTLTQKKRLPIHLITMVLRSMKPSPWLLDPYALTKEDAHSKGEQRFITLGMGGKNRVLVVIWTLRDDRIRLISAWKANQPQRRRYEEQY